LSLPKQQALLLLVVWLNVRIRLPTLDSCHFQIAHALRNDGWKVVEKPTYIDATDATKPIYIDLAASKGSNGTEGRQVYIEVKCFPGKNETQETYIAFRQYIIYRALLAEQEIFVPLYLAGPSTIVNKQITNIVWRAVRDNGIKLLIVDVLMETITQWIE
jgi:hypothetical protein